MTERCSTRTGLLAVCLVLLAGLFAPAQARNGKLALVYPVAGVTVDGDLSDWPQDLTRHAVQLHQDGVSPRNAQDFQAWFRVGFDEQRQALLLAVEVEDESVLSATTAAPVPDYTWNTRDGCEVYLDLGPGRPEADTPQSSRDRPAPPPPRRPMPGGLGASVLQFALYGESLEAYGPRGRLDDSQLAWVWAGVRVEFRRTANRHSYEWRIDVGYLTQDRVPLLPGAEFGLDVALCDRDADSFSWMAWGPGTRKASYPERMGTAILVARGADPQEAVERFLEHSLSGTTTGGDVRVQQVRASTSYQMFLTGALLTFTVLHLLLFLFYPSGRTNLYYALFTGLTAGAIFSGFQVDFSAVQLSLSPDSYTNFFTLGLYLTVLLVILFGLLFLYSLFYPRLPRRFWVFAVGLGGTAVFMGLVLMGRATFSQEILPVPLLFIAAALAETVRVVFRAIRQKKDGAWTVGMGFLAFGLAVLFLIVVNSSQSEVSLSAILGVFFPLVSMSVYLARNFARVNRDLQSQLGQVQQLSTRTHEQNRALERANQQIQEQNRQIQQANRLKSEFLARMSHDLRTPMNAIIGYTRILLRKTQDVLDERQYRNLANIRISADQLLALINDILDLSRIEAGRFEVRLEQVDLRHLAAECAEAMAPLLRSEVELRQLLEPVPALHTDADRLRRVLMNLLGNAAKFTEQGSITLSVRRADSGVELTVADTGVGIPAEELPYIFDEFRQVARKGSTAQEGTGLGLAIVKKYVDLLGGRIAVESTVAQGTRFVLHLRDYPATKAP